VDPVAELSAATARPRAAVADSGGHSLRYELHNLARGTREASQPVVEASTTGCLHPRKTDHTARQYRYGGVYFPSRLLIAFDRLTRMRSNALARLPTSSCDSEITGLSSSPRLIWSAACSRRTSGLEMKAH